MPADGWDKRWLKSTWKQKDGSAGEFKLTAGKWYGDEEADKGIQTSQDSKFYAISAELKKPFTNDKKDLVVQVRAPTAPSWSVGDLNAAPLQHDAWLSHAKVMQGHR